MSSSGRGRGGVGRGAVQRVVIGERRGGGNDTDTLPTVDPLRNGMAAAAALLTCAGGVTESAH